jgi:hypothetical protein
VGVLSYLQAAVLSESPEKNVLNHSTVSMTARSTWSREKIGKAFYLERYCRLLPEGHGCRRVVQGPITPADLVQGMPSLPG